MKILVARNLQMMLYALLTSHYEVIICPLKNGRTLIVHRNPAKWMGKKLREMVGGKKYKKWERYPEINGFTTRVPLNDVIEKISQGHPDLTLENFS